MMKTFELTENTIDFAGRTLYQIRAIADFDFYHLTIDKGTWGGWVESESSIADGCWVAGGFIFKEANIYGGDILGGIIYGGEIYDGAEIWGGTIYGGEIRGGEICGGKIYGGKIYGGKISGGEMHSGTFLLNKLTHGQIFKK